MKEAFYIITSNAMLYGYFFRNLKHKKRGIPELTGLKTKRTLIIPLKYVSTFCCLNHDYYLFNIQFRSIFSSFCIDSDKIGVSTNKHTFNSSKEEVSLDTFLQYEVIPTTDDATEQHVSEPTNEVNTQ